MSLLFKQVKALLIRNYYVKRQRKSETFQEVIMPIYFVVLLVVLKLVAFKPQSYPEMSKGNQSSLFFSDLNPIQNLTHLYIAPEFPEASNLMKTIANFSILSPNINIAYFNSKAEMEEAYINTTFLNPIGIYFPNSSSIQSYMIRFPYTSLPSSNPYDASPTNCRLGTRCPAEQYLSSGFTPLQALLDAGIMKLNNANFTLPNITVQRMAKSGGIANADVFQLLSSFYLVMAFSPFLIFLLVYVVNEKEKKIKEGMKMMGLNNLALWLGWSLTYTILVLVMTLIMAILAVLGRLFPKSNFFLIFLIFFLYGISLQMMSFMLTPFFSKAKTAGAVGSLLSLILSLFFLIVFYLPNMSTAVVCLLHLISPAGFAIGLNQIAVLELTSDGANFDSITSGRIPLYLTYVFLAVDIVLYFLLTLYFDSVIPSEYGQRKPLLYCLMPSFWCPPKKVPKVDDEFSTDVTAEREPVDTDFIGKEAIVIRNVTKVYEPFGLLTKAKDSTTAVQNFSLNIYEGQITAILGHNGAGKTTLFNILTGFVEATTGSARIYDYDVTNTFDMSKIRQMTGVCPQHNILNDELTVMQHLELYAGIKGIPDEKIKSEINRVINLVDLEDQVDTLSIKLSGGQKRKLSVGIAIIGDPKILILDEPTAGMDPYSRHKLWNVLRSRKAGRITLLTTHFMDEADILADRKIILSKGKLRCVGSSLFLKNKYGVGYHLGIVTKTSNKVEGISDCVKSHIADSELHRSAGFELSYTLPLSEVGRFAGLFADLESKGENLEIQSYGVSMTNLEEVFLRIGEEDESDDTSSQDEEHDLKSKILPHHSNGAFENINLENVEEGNRSAFNDLRSQSGKLKQRNIFQALLLKTFYVKIRSPAVIVFGLLLPMGLVIGSAAIYSLTTTTVNDQSDPQPIPLSPATYGKMLYKNSTGGSLDQFLQYPSGVSVIESNLTNLLTPGFNPMASDIFSVDSLKLKYNALFNTTAVHSLPSIINFMSTSMLSMVSGNYSQITCASKRWPSFVNIPQFSGSSFGGTLMAAIAVVLSSSLAIVNPMKEKELKIRSQLRVSGAPFHIYWSSLFIIDYLWFLCVALAMIIGVLAFQVPFFVQPGAILALILLLIGWGVSCVLSSYCGSFIFKTSETAQAAWPNIVQLSGLLPYIIVALLDQLGSASAALYINVVLCLFIPFYVGFGGIYYISKVYNVYGLRGISNIPTAVYFDWSQPMVPYTILIAYLQAFLLFTLLKSLDVVSAGGSIFDVFPFSLYKKHKTTVHAEENGSLLDTEDDDVRNEQSKISEIIKQGNFAEREDLPVVITHNLNKTFVKKKSIINCKKKEPEVKVAVKSLSLSVYPGEVFGLLGPNGAGKTTAINTITADFAPTKGQIFVSGHSIQSNLSQVFQEMGYCPQDNPLWEEITLREHLEIYATTQGLSKQVVPAAAERCIKALGVEEHAHKRAKFLSGGTKRKVCFAIAMIGNPQVVLLDEPSTGMDPKTKRFMWNTISSAFEGSDRGAILTTHYMDEADALCSRVGIMVKGQLQCLGSTQHLKNKFGQGYSLELKVQQHVDTNNQDQIKVFVENLFGEGVTQTDHFAHRFVYKIPQEGMPSLSKIFSSLEQAKTELGIEEYSFSQSTLEQVFLQFARKQELEDTDC